MSTKSYLFLLIFALMILMSSCQRISTESAYDSLANEPLSTKKFRKSLAVIANDLYHKKWAINHHFVKPRFRQENAIYDWYQSHHKISHKKTSKIRPKNGLERLAYSYLFNQSGPVSPDHMVKSVHFRLFLETFLSYLQKEEVSKEDVLLHKTNLLNSFGILDEQARKNEEAYQLGILVASGFYLGLPLYKRITIDQAIDDRKLILSIYLHECGHQIFHSSRKFSKSLKLGLGWIGWAESQEEWWQIEEKSCNLFAEELMKLIPTAFWGLENQKAKNSSTKLLENYRERYFALFFNPERAREQYSNKRINNRYSTTDELALSLKKYLDNRGIEQYTKDLNKIYTIKEAKQILLMNEQ